MKKITSFTINHLTLLPGIYESRYDQFNNNEGVTTFDIRMTAPNRQPALSISALHAMEHLVATWLRNHPTWSDKIIYWGPMGCCTGNYLLVKGHPSPNDIRLLMADAMHFVANFNDAIPGASPKDCGNYLLMNLPEAQMAAKNFLSILQSDNCPTQYGAQ